MGNANPEEILRGYSVMRPDNVEKSFKCSQCGMMFTDPGNDLECPFCHHHCQPGECEMVYSSNEDY